MTYGSLGAIIKGNRIECIVDWIEFIVPLPFFSFQSEEGHSPIIVSLAAISDHSLISTKILINKVDNVNEESNKSRSFKLNTSLLKDSDNKEAIRMVTFLISL